MFSASQIRAARAILNWSREELAAAAKVSLATVRKLEMGEGSSRNATIDAIKFVLESAGIEFLGLEGVRIRPSGISIYEGKVGGADFMEDLRQAVGKYGADVNIVTPTAADFARYCGVQRILDLDILLKLNSSNVIRCIMTDESEALISSPRFQFRIISKNYVDPVPFCLYGSKYALAVPNGEPFSKLITIDSAKMAALANRHFVSLWEKATPLFMASAKQSRALSSAA
ncbi:MAG: helix-turn-helix transcriptional regulator [Alphaproteobacteria bacterium]|nr:helix-turn-helix transcriptional regulator [Alphaproteobacteria bacterium]